MFDNETDVLARLDELRQQRNEAKQAEAALLAEILRVLRIAGTMRIDGKPIDRSLLIKRSGLSRKTAYRVLEPLPKGAEPWSNNLSQ